jgi:hypothetical protein
MCPRVTLLRRSCDHCCRHRKWEPLQYLRFLLLKMRNQLTIRDISELSPKFHKTWAGSGSTITLTKKW